MKFLLPTTLVFSLLAASHGYCQLMKTMNDAHLLARNDSLLFRGRPLKNLLQEIGPEIKMVFVEDHRDHGAPAYIVFNFVNRQEWRNYNCAGKRPVRVTVYLKEYFDWGKLPGDVLNWTKADADRLGHLTIVYTRVSGEVLTDDVYAL